MKIRNFIILTIFILFGILFSYKVNAIDINYCKYNKDISLTLPTTIGYDLSGVIYNNMFSNDRIYETHTKTIKTKDDCIKGLNDDSYQDKNFKYVYRNDKKYMVNINYFYLNSDKKISVNTELVNGIYSTLDMTPPLIESSVNPIKANSDFKISIDNLKSYINYHDNVDTNLNLEITYDGYSNNYNKPGKYSINYRVCDKSNNCTSYTQKIEVYDKTNPIIKGNNKFTSYMSNPLTILDIASNLTAYDNVDKDLSNKIYLEKSTYNIDYPGKYYAYFNVKDSSNNTLINPFKVEINYLDDIKPTIEGPNNFISYMSNPLTSDSILLNLTFFDNIDSNLNENIYIIKDDFSNNKYNIGCYKIVISVMDNSNNESLPFIIEVKIIDDIKPTISGDSTYTSLMSSPISILTIKNRLIGYDNIDGNINHKIEVVSDEYSINSNKVGTYLVSFVLKDSSNNISDTFNVEITTIDDILPIIKGENYYSTTTDSKLNIDSITNLLKVSDNIDQNIENKLVLDKENYSDNFNIPGVYYLKYYACDNSGNISLPFKIKIVVNENISYINSINNSHIHLLKDKLISDKEILNIVGIDSNNFNEIKIVENTYTNNYSKKGNYKIIYELVNTDYTKENLTININVYDDDHKKEDLNQDLSLIENKKKKETIFSFIASFFKNLFNSFINLFK